MASLERKFTEKRPGAATILDRIWEQTLPAVVMIDVKHPNAGKGSGFIASFSEPLKENYQTYLVTCYHVLESIEGARNAEIYFDRVKDDGVCVSASELLHLDVFEADEALDYFIVAVNEDTLRQKNLKITPLKICPVDTQIKSGYTAYIVHHPSLEGRVLVSMTRCHNSCEIIDFEDPIIAHHLHTEQGSSGSPILIADEKGELQVCGLHLGYHGESPPLFNRALYVHSMCQHLQTGKRPSCTIDAAVAIIRSRTDESTCVHPEEDLESMMKRFTSKNTVVISKVPEQVSDHYMLLYLNSICDSKNPVLRRKCTWSQFLALFDYDCSGEVVQQLTEQSLRFPLQIPNGQKCYIEAHQLTPPDGVHIRNISECNSSALESIEAYFTNEGRSGGKDVKSVTVGPNKSRIVLFKDPTSVKKVMSKEHKGHFGDSVKLDLFHSVLTYWTVHSPWQVEPVRKGIVYCDTDVYVNSPPGTLCLKFGGLSRSMLQVGGKEFEDACEEYRKQRGKVKAGDIAVTGGGKMKCKYVIHAVGTECPKDESKAKEVMSKLVNKVLEKCKSLEMSSVAIPALGTGNLHYPPKVSAQAIVETVKTYLYSNACCSLKKVVLVANDENMYREFEKYLNRWL